MFGGASYQIINNAIDVAAYTYGPTKRQEMRRQRPEAADAADGGRLRGVFLLCQCNQPAV